MNRVRAPRRTRPGRGPSWQVAPVPTCGAGRARYDHLATSSSVARGVQLCLSPLVTGANVSLPRQSPPAYNA